MMQHPEEKAVLLQQLMQVVGTMAGVRDASKTAAVLNKLAAAAELQDWQTVPTRVRQLYKEAQPLAARVVEATEYLPASLGYGEVYYHPEKQALHAVLGDRDDEHHMAWRDALETTGCQVTIADCALPDAPEEWIRVKRADGPLGFFNKPFEWGGKLTGGPSPLSNALVGSLLTGGLGYGSGWLLEHLFPEKYVERGRLRRTLGLLGAAGGALPGVLQYGQNAATAQEAGKPLGWLGTAITPTDNVPVNPAALQRLQEQTRSMGPHGAHYDPARAEYVGERELRAAHEQLGASALPDYLANSLAGLFKTAYDGGQAGGVGLRAVPMDAFNRAIWNDVQAGMTASRNIYGTKSPWGDNSQALHTPPQLGAATSGLVSGIQEMYGGQSVLSPMHFVRGLATAGVDMATAKIVGGTLGALGGLTPLAQEKLQDVGLWGGLIRGTVGSMLGMR